MSEFVIMGNGRDYCEMMCRDIICADNVIFINKVNNLKSIGDKLLDRLLQKVSIKTNISLFRPRYFRSYLCGTDIPGNKNIRFIIFDSNAHARDKFFLKYLRNKYRAKLVLYVINPTSSISLDAQHSHLYDLVFTVYRQDADAYGWHVCNHVYSKIPSAKAPDEDGYVSDVFFAGRAKNRLQEILRAYEFLVSHDLKCDFHISEVAGKDMRHSRSIAYNQWLPYEEMIGRMLQSKCVLEVLQKNGEGPTLRMVEAIVYNKKILTNDAGAAKNPFYDDRFVQIFDNPRDINLNFIKNDTQPRFHYQGEYSAKNFLGRVDENLDAKHNRHKNI